MPWKPGKSKPVEHRKVSIRITNWGFGKIQPAGAGEGTFMMNRFTEKAQEALQRAQQIMFARQHTQLDVEHIFLALLQQLNGLPVQIIAHLNGDVQAMVRRLESALNDVQNYNPKGRNAAGY